MKARLLFLLCMAMAGCNKPPASENARNEKAAPKADPKPPLTQANPPAKPAEDPFDLLRDTARVREALAGTWYQVDHMPDGSSSSLTAVWLFADGTARDEYWTLIHAERIAMHGYDRGRWELRGDTIAFHFEGKPRTATTAPSTPVKAPNTAPAPADDSEKPRDDEQRLLQATKNWFTYEYRNNVSPSGPGTQPQPPFRGVSVRVQNDFKQPRSIPGYRTEGPDLEPPAAVEKLIK